MFDLYLRLERALFRQDTEQVGRVLLITQLAGAGILLLAGNDSDRIRAAAMLAGALAVGGGLRLRRRAPFWGKVVIAVAGFPVTFLFAAVSPALGVLAMIVYFLALVIAIVA
jgi:hypothetical protein